MGSLGDPKYDILECQSRGFSYVVPLKITFQLRYHESKDDQGPGEILRSEVYMGEIPLMTEQGTFIINGSERVIKQRSKKERKKKRRKEKIKKQKQKKEE